MQYSILAYMRARSGVKPRGGHATLRGARAGKEKFREGSRSCTEISGGWSLASPLFALSTLDSQCQECFTL